MSRYAKDPSFFRAVYVDHMTRDRRPTPLGDQLKPPKTRARYAMEFDDMLEWVREEAWNEGADAMMHNFDTGNDVFNPYRKGLHE